MREFHQRFAKAVFNLERGPASKMGDLNAEDQESHAANFRLMLELSGAQQTSVTSPVSGVLQVCR